MKDYLLKAPCALKSAISGQRWVALLLVLLAFGPKGLSGEPGPTEAFVAVQRTITGTVTDWEGVPLSAVTVYEKGTTNGTYTDFDGKYTLEIQGDAILVFSFLGFRKQEIPTNGSTTINASMQEDRSNLDEVVITGYMTQRKADLTGSVATVTSEDIEKNPYTNIIQGLQGKLAGVQITADGSPAGGTNIQIRGLTSLRGAPPLIVIDGLATTINLNDINSNDIASLQVLKDAASASIYGSRAAGGVILIETKKGRVGKPTINYKSTVGFSTYLEEIRMLNTQQYGRAHWQAAVNDGSDPNAMTQVYDYDWHTDPSGIPVLDAVNPVEWLNAQQTMPSADTKWFDAGTRAGLQTNHNLSISSGSEHGNKYLGLSYYKNEGTQIHSYFKRYNLRFNSDYNLLDGKLVIGQNLSISHLDYNNQWRTYEMLRMPSIVPVHTLDGGWGGSAVALGMDDYWNPIRQLTMDKDNNYINRTVVGNIFADLQLLPGLHLRTSYGLQYNSGKYRHIDFTWEEGGGRSDPNNGVNASWNEDLTQTWTNTLNYGLRTRKHDLDLMVGTELVHFGTEFIRGFRRDIEIEDYDYAYLGSATGNQEVYGGGDEWALVSYFSKFNYAFDEKYLLSATLRYDGSSKFGKSNQFGWFPAVSGGWRLSQENFLKDSKVVSDLKLRASWGRNGNSNIPTNALTDIFDAAYNSGLHGTSYGLAGNETGTLASGYRKIHTGNPNLKWEATEQTNIGLDFGFFNGALSGSVDYFEKDTDGMLFEPPYLAAIGEAGFRWVNAASMTNTGFEFVATYLGRVGQDFRFSVSANASTYRNEINDLPESVKYTYGGNGLDDTILGRPRFSHYGFIADGLFTTQDQVDNSAEQPGKGLGRIRYRDLNQDGRITWEHDRTWLGTSDPDWSYGLNFSADYKGFDFSMFWQGIMGNTVWNDWKTYSDFWNVHVQKGLNHPVRILDAWSLTNPDSTIPALSLINPNDELRPSTYFLESGSYLKLRQIEFGYSLPQKVLSDLGVARIRLALSAQNLLGFHKESGPEAFTGIDPESPAANAYIRPQIFLFTLDVSL